MKRKERITKIYILIYNHYQLLMRNTSTIFQMEYPNLSTVIPKRDNCKCKSPNTDTYPVTPPPPPPCHHPKSLDNTGNYSITNNILVSFGVAQLRICGIRRNIFVTKVVIYKN